MFAHRCYMPDEVLEGGVFARRLPHTIKPAAWEVSNIRCKHLRSLHQPKAKGHRAKRKAKRKQQRAARKGK